MESLLEERDRYLCSRFSSSVNQLDARSSSASNRSDQTSPKSIIHVSSSKGTMVSLSSLAPNSRLMYVFFLSLGFSIFISVPSHRADANKTSSIIGWDRVSVVPCVCDRDIETRWAYIVVHMRVYMEWRLIRGIFMLIRELVRHLIREFSPYMRRNL